jgi:hypothetical protein
MTNAERTLNDPHARALQGAYIELLKSAVTNRLYDEAVAPPGRAELDQCESALSHARDRFSHVERGTRTALELSAEQYYYFLRKMDVRRPVHTMTVESGVENVVALVRDVLERNVPGDIIETGVWKGGLTILMRGVLMAYGETRRRVWVADSFCGVPVPERTAEDRIAHFLAMPLSYLAVPRLDVERNFAKYGLLDDQVVFLEGLFADTLPTAPIAALALARLDGDSYESTMDCLVHLYPKLSIGGYVVIDDYGLPLGCRRAVDEYRSRNGIEEEPTWVNQQTIFWQRTR